MAKPNLPAILYLSSTKLTFYHFALENALDLNFDSDLVADLEVKKSGMMIDSVRIFIDQNKLTPCPFITILAEEICYKKNFPAGSAETKKDEIKQFLDLVPFENVRSKNYSIEKGFNLIAVNRDFYEIVESAFEKFGFKADATIPFSVLSLTLPVGPQDKSFTGEVYKKLSYIRQNTLSGPVFNLNTPGEKKAFIVQNKTTLFLLGVFGLLIIVLGIILVVLNPLNIGKKPQTIKKVDLTPEVVVPAPTPPVASVAAEIPIDQLKVSIVNVSSLKGLAGNTRETFLELGFKEIAVGSVSKANVQTNLVYTASVSARILDLLTTKLKEKFPTLTVSQSEGLDYSLILTIGSNN